MLSLEAMRLSAVCGQINLLPRIQNARPSPVNDAWLAEAENRVLMIWQSVANVALGLTAIAMGWGVIELLRILLVSDDEPSTEPCENGVQGCNGHQCVECQMDQAW